MKIKRRYLAPPHASNDLEAHRMREAKLIEAAIKDIDFFIEFEGMNCEGPCAGWDGVDSRCECGNRRVMWEILGNGTSVSAVAW